MNKHNNNYCPFNELNSFYFFYVFKFVLRQSKIGYKQKQSVPGNYKIIKACYYLLSKTRTVYERVPFTRKRYPYLIYEKKRPAIIVHYSYIK